MEGPQSVGHTCNICLDTLGANGGVSTLLCGESQKFQLWGKQTTPWVTPATMTLLMLAGHPFCRECLARWQATSHLCPVCRADQRTLDRTGSQGVGESSGASETDEADHLEGPSLATILGLMGQLLAREGAGLSEVYPPSAPHEGSGVHFAWSSRPTGNSVLQQPELNTAVIDELRSSVQFVMARIDSLERRPLYWNSQTAELQEALEALDACRHGTARNPAQIIQQVQLYTDTVNAQLDEFLTQTEAREQQRRTAEHRQQAHASQPSAPPFASAPPQPGTGTYSSNARTSAASSGTTEANQNSRTWKWGWGPAPAGTTSAEGSAPNSSSSDSQQTSGIGFGAAAAAAAALAAVGTAAKAAYRRATADRSDANATAAGTNAAGSSTQQQQQPTGSNSALYQQSPAGAAGGSSATGSQAAQPPVQGMYNAVRGIFDQHVSADSSLGRWGEVAHHLTDLHGQMNADDPQRQDVGRLLASAVNAYSAYRRATASSSSSSSSR